MTGFVLQQGKAALQHPLRMQQPQTVRVMGETLRLMINLCSAGGLPAVVPVVQRDTAPLQVLSSRFAQSLCGLVQPLERQSGASMGAPPG